MDATAFADHFQSCTVSSDCVKPSCQRSRDESNVRKQDRRKVLFHLFAFEAENPLGLLS